MTLQEQYEQPGEPWVPAPYMKRGVRWLLEHGAGALFLDPGGKKTSITLAALKILKQKGLLEPVLVVCPRRPMWMVWPKELRKWTDFHGLTYQVLHGKGRTAEALAHLQDINLINPEGLKWLLSMTRSYTESGKVKVGVDPAKFKALGFGILVIDELSKFKSHQAQRVKALKQVLHLFSRRWGLTGSPAANGLMGLFSECYMLDCGRTFGPYITHFHRMYYDQDPYQKFQWTIKPGADKLIFERIRPLAMRMDPKEYAALPQLVYNDIYVELPEAARKVYDDLESDLFAKIKDKVVTAANAAVASMKIRQVAAGGVYLDPEDRGLEGKIKVAQGKRSVTVHMAKAEALADLVDELEGQQVFVAYDFLHDLDRINAALGYKVPYIGGGITDKRADELVAKWNVGELPVLLGHPQSVGHGLNLQEGNCRHVCWFSLTWDWELFDQFLRRVWRSGNKASRVTCHRLIAKDTIDEDVLVALQDKDRGQRALFEALQKRCR